MEEEKIKEYIKIEDKKLPQILKILDGVSFKFSKRLLLEARRVIDEKCNESNFQI